MRKFNRKQLGLYGFAGFGPNMLNLIIGTYLCDALMTQGFKADIENWTYLNKTLVVAVVWSVMIAVAKIIDGLADIPLASMTDTLKTRWGKRRPAIVIGAIPMLAAFLLFLLPISGRENSLANTIWFGAMLAIFYTFYTLTMLAYYATFSEVTVSAQDRVVLSNWKAGYDIVYFVLGYALIPMLIGNINIRMIALMFVPCVLTMLIPLFMLKERSTLPADVARYKAEHPEDEEANAEEAVGFFDSLWYTFKNRDFLIWMVVYAALQFGLQMYLTGQNVFFSGMNFEGWRITVINASCFAPVPLTLILYNAIVRRRGFRTGYQYAVGTFALAMVIATAIILMGAFSDSSRFILVIATCLLTSLGIGAFFSVSYIIPAQIAAEEVKRTGKSHPSMYFAIQGLAEAGVTAISTGLVWVNLKNAGKAHFMTLIVAAACVASFLLAFLLPASLNKVGKQGEEQGG